MKTFLSSLLKLIAGLLLTLASILLLAGVWKVLQVHGLFGLLDFFSPFNISGFIIRVLMFLPGILVLGLANKLKGH